MCVHSPRFIKKAFQRVFFAQASNSDQNSIVNKLKDLLSKIPHGGGENSQMDQAESLHAASQAYHLDPNNVAPPEVQRQLLALLKWRDGVYRAVLKKIEMVPGLSTKFDSITDALNACKFAISVISKRRSFKHLIVII